MYKVRIYQKGVEGYLFHNEVVPFNRGMVYWFKGTAQRAGNKYVDQYGGLVEVVTYNRRMK